MLTSLRAGVLKLLWGPETFPGALEASVCGLLFGESCLANVEVEDLEDACAKYAWELQGLFTRGRVCACDAAHLVRGITEGYPGRSAAHKVGRLHAVPCSPGVREA